MLVGGTRAIELGSATYSTELLVSLVNLAEGETCSVFWVLHPGLVLDVELGIIASDLLLVDGHVLGLVEQLLRGVSREPVL